MLFGKLKNCESYGFGVFKEQFVSFKEIDDKEHINLIKEANTKGKIIGADDNGNPILINPPSPTEEELIHQKIIEYETYLKDTDWYIIRCAETSKAIPSDVKTKRAEAREQLSLLRNKE